jgi:tellurite resistance protein
MKIETAAEACAALAVMIVAADELGTDEERQFLFQSVKALPIFADLDGSEFMALIADTTEALYASLPTDGGRLSSDGVGQLVGMIRDALPAEQRVQALEAAVGLARSDGIVSGEALLLQRLCEGLDIAEDVKGRLLGEIG